MRLNTEHHSVIVSYAEEHPEIITNKFTGLNDKQKQEQVWQALVNKLNSLGYGILSVAEYKRRISDWKSKTKAKAVEANKSITKTGGGEGNYIFLTKIELRLLAIMGNKSYEGDSSVEEMGCKKKKTSSNDPPSLTLFYPANEPNNLIRKNEKPTTVKSAASITLVPAGDSNQKEIKSTKKEAPSRNLFYSGTETFSLKRKNEKPETITSEALITWEDENEDFSLMEEIVETNVKENIAPSTDHQYYSLKETPKTNSFQNTDQRTPSVATRRRRNLSYMTESINSMNSKTLNVLENIDNNLTGINANLGDINNSIKTIATILTNKYLH